MDKDNRTRGIRVAWRRMGVTALAVAVLAGLPGIRGHGALASSRAATGAGTVVTASAVQVAAFQLRMALATGQFGEADQQDPAPPAFRTTDGGRSWTLLRLPGELTAPPNPYGAYSYDPPIMAADGRHIWINERYQSSPDASNQGIAFSADGGAHWPLDNPQGNPVGGAGGDQIVALDPFSADGLYTYEQDQGGSTLLRSSPGSQDEILSDPSTLAPSSADATLTRLLPDTALPRVLYAKVSDAESGNLLFVARSTDGGAHWRRVRLPDGITPAVTISVDSHLPGRLLLRPAGPFHRLYSSADGGATWQFVSCPGVLHGSCPSAVADNVFGAGRSYGLYADGLHAFSGAGPAGPRLPITDHLPLPPSAITTIAAGRQAGGPIFVVGAADPTAPTVVYRSGDGGQHWSRAIAGVLPTTATPDRAAQALYVPRAHHSVAPMFVALYRKLGLDLTGYPLDEAYQEGDEVVQDFGHLELMRSSENGSTPAIGRLAVEDCALHCPTAATRPASRDGMTAGVYVAATHHTVRGVFLAFWQRHQQAIGAPISEAFRSSNNDGSGRTYLMQYFTNARLEWHPEYHSARYAVQLGLVGVETLKDWGWASARG